MAFDSPDTANCFVYRDLRGFPARLRHQVVRSNDNQVELFPGSQEKKFVDAARACAFDNRSFKTNVTDHHLDKITGSAIRIRQKQFNSFHTSRACKSTRFATISIEKIWQRLEPGLRIVPKRD